MAKRVVRLGVDNDSVKLSLTVDIETTDLTLSETQRTVNTVADGLMNALAYMNTFGNGFSLSDIRVKK